jgi:hypothetical protein
MPGNSEVFLSSVTCTGATTTRLEESRNVGELAGEVGDVAVLGDAGQVRGSLAAQRTGAGLAWPTAFPWTRAFTGCADSPHDTGLAMFPAGRNVSLQRGSCNSSKQIRALTPSAPRGPGKPGR